MRLANFFFIFHQDKVIELHNSLCERKDIFPLEVLQRNYARLLVKNSNNLFLTKRDVGIL